MGRRRATTRRGEGRETEVECSPKSFSSWFKHVRETTNGHQPSYGCVGRGGSILRRRSDGDLKGGHRREGRRLEGRDVELADLGTSAPRSFPPQLDILFVRADLTDVKVRE